MGVFSTVGVSGAYQGFRGGYSGAWERAQAGARGYTVGHMAGSAVRGIGGMAGGAVGRSLKYGTLESFGFDVGPGGVRSWMGGRETLGHLAKGRIGKGLFTGMTRGGLGLAFTASFVYQGWKEEGLWGAAKGAGESILGTSLFRLAGAVLPGAMMYGGIATGVAAMAYGAYRWQRNAVDYNKKLRRSEFVAGNINDPFGNLSTLRQRSIRALHSNNMGGRITLGREAQLLGG